MQFAPVGPSSLFRPERIEGESFSNYKRRRALAQQVAKTIEGPARSTSFSVARNDVRRAKRAEQLALASQRQIRTIEKERKHKRAESHTCLAVGRIKDATGRVVGRRTWREGEPFIYVRPLRHLASLLTSYEGTGNEKVKVEHPDLRKAQLAANKGYGLVVKAYLRKHGAL